MLLKYIKEPLLYQGRHKKGNYFEGWYFKHVSADLKTTISVIPGMARSGQDSHAFIQTIISRNTPSGQKLETHYCPFLIRKFRVCDEPFCLQIGNNRFHQGGVKLDLENQGVSLRGAIRYSRFTPIRTSSLFPNSMGYFAYLPFMECSHGIISMSHDLTGFLTLNGERYSFDGGKGYLEKDWGTSFPKNYLWIQSNHFLKSDASFMCSVAAVPFLGLSFRGFICILTFEGREYRFASYNGGSIQKIDCQAGRLNVTLERDGWRLDIRAKAAEGGCLKAPESGRMDTVIKEGLNGTVDVRLTDNAGKTVFRGAGNPCGIEAVNSFRL